MARGAKNLPALGAFAGLRNDIELERFKPEDLAVANNADIDDAGQAKRRGGMRRIGDAAHSVWSDGSTCLFARDDTLFLLNPDYSAQAVAAGLSGDPVSYISQVGKVYYTDGAVSGVFEDGRARAWGIKVPPPPALSLIGGSFAPGQYGVVLTYQRADGQESGASALSLIDITEPSGIRIGLPVPPEPAVTRMWMTQANSEIVYHFADFAYGSVSADILGPDWPRATACQTRFLSPPPAGQAISVHQGRLWVSAGDQLFPSEPFAYELFDLRAHVPIDGTRITLAAPVLTGIFVGTEIATYFLRGLNPKEMDLDPLSGTGVVEGSLAWIDGSLITDGANTGTMVPIWTSRDGAVLAGTKDGVAFEMSRPRYTLPAGNRAAAIGRSAPGMNQYLVTMQ